MSERTLALLKSYLDTSTTMQNFASELREGELKDCNWKNENEVEKLKAMLRIAFHRNEEWDAAEEQEGQDT